MSEKKGQAGVTQPFRFSTKEVQLEKPKAWEAFSREEAYCDMEEKVILPAITILLIIPIIISIIRIIVLLIINVILFIMDITITGHCSISLTSWWNMFHIACIE